MIAQLYTIDRAVDLVSIVSPIKCSAEILSISVYRYLLFLWSKIAWDTLFFSPNWSNKVCMFLLITTQNLRRIRSNRAKCDIFPQKHTTLGCSAVLNHKKNHQMTPETINSNVKIATFYGCNL